MMTRFDFENTHITPIELFEDLKDAMIDNNMMGLTAPQINYDYTVFAIGNPTHPDSIIPVFNPRLVHRSPETNLQKETHDGLHVDIRRSNEIRVRFQLLDGVIKTAKLEGLTARLFQREYDKIHGKKLKDIATRFHIDRAKKNAKLAMRKEKNV